MRESPAIAGDFVLLLILGLFLLSLFHICSISFFSIRLILSLMVSLLVLLK